MSENCFWFGTEDRMGWIPAPLVGGDSSPSAWQASGTMLNGGGWASHSWDSHKEYVYEWSPMSSPSVAQLMKSYRDGTFGRGLLYFLDPTTYGTNILPSRWASPSVSIGNEAPSLVYGVEPTPEITSGAFQYGLPVTSARYDLTNVTPQTTAAEDSSVFIPIPEGYTLFVGSIYSATGSGGVFVTPIGASGAPEASLKLTALPVSTLPQVSEQFSGNLRGVRLWVGRTAGGSGSVTITSMTARLMLTSSVPVYTPWVETARNLFTNPSFVGSGTVPVFENLFTNPNLVGSGTWAEARRNIVTTLGSANGATLSPPVGPERVISVTPVAGNDNTGVVFLDITGTGRTTSMSLDVTAGSVPAIVRITGTQGWGSGSPVTIPAGQTQRISRSGTFTGNGYMYVTVNASSGTVVMKRPLAEDGSISGSYLDGSTKPADLSQPEDFRTRWLGAVNASESVLEIETVRGLTTPSGACIAGVSTRDGKPAVRLIATGTTPYTSAAFGVTGADVRASGTLMGTVHMDAPLTGPLAVPSSRVGNLMALAPEQAAPGASNTAGTRALRLHFSSLTSDFRVFWYHGGAQGSGDVWWTDLGLFAGVYNGPAFSGNASPDPDLTASWSGATNNSTSVLRGVPVTGVVQGGLALGIRSSRGGQDAIRVIRLGAATGNEYVYTASALGSPRFTGILSVWRDTVAANRASSVADLERASGAWTGITLMTGAELPPPGEWKIARKTRDFPSMDARFLLRAPGTPGESFWYSWPGIFAGDYNGPWFSGDSTPSNPDLERFHWLGAMNDSASVRETRMLTSGSPGLMDELRNRPWIGGQGHSGCRFLQPPSYVTNWIHSGGKVGFAASFTEVGDWVYG